MSAGTKAPWETIRAGVIADRAPRRLGFRASISESPCDACTTATCCTYLPLHTFSVSTLLDVSYVGYLLNFERIRLGLSSNGQWSVYYVEPCGFLDRSTLRCTVHGTSKQPNICQHYNPYSCWYRPTLGAMATADFVLVDRTRFEWLAERLVFDEERRLVEVPSFADTVDAFADLSDEAGPAPRAEDDAVHDAWVDIALGRRAANQDSVREPAFTSYSVSDRLDRCEGCAAPCCDTVTFSQGVPGSVASLDHLRFCLGFPGIELLIDDTQWWIAVRTRCRHLQDGRCGIYGSPDRPLQCTFYDADKCTYVEEFANPRPAHAVRVRYDDFESLAGGVTIDGQGRVVSVEPVPLLRERIESRWREDAAARG